MTRAVNDRVAQLEQWRPEPPAGDTKMVALSPMLRNVLESLCEGKSNKQIMADWGIAEDTVKTHMRRLFQALGANDRLHAVALVWSGTVDVRLKADVGRWADPNDHHGPPPVVDGTQGRAALYPPRS